MLLTEEEQKIVSEGLQAQSLLETPYFKELINSLVQECADQMLLTDLLDKEIREAHYFKYQGIKSLTDTLHQRVENKNYILQRLEEEAADGETESE